MTVAREFLDYLQVMMVMEDWSDWRKSKMAERIVSHLREAELDEEKSILVEALCSLYPHTLFVLEGASLLVRTRDYKDLPSAVLRGADYVESVEEPLPGEMEDWVSIQKERDPESSLRFKSCIDRAAGCGCGSSASG